MMKNALRIFMVIAVLLTNAAGYHSHAAEHGELVVAGHHHDDDGHDHDEYASAGGDSQHASPDNSSHTPDSDMHSHAVSTIAFYVAPAPSGWVKSVLHLSWAGFAAFDLVKPLIEPPSHA